MLRRRGTYTVNADPDKRDTRIKNVLPVFYLKNIGKLRSFVHIFIFVLVNRFLLSFIILNLALRPKCDVLCLVLTDRKYFKWILISQVTSKQYINLVDVED